MLWALARKDVEEPFAGLPQPPAPGLTSVLADPSAPQGFYEALGFRLCGTRAVRLDMLERIADLIRPVIAARTYNGGFVVTPDMMSLVGCSGERSSRACCKSLGCRSQRGTDRAAPGRLHRGSSRRQSNQRSATLASATSAEAALAEIVDAIAAPVVGEMPEAVPEPQTDAEAAAPAVAVPGETGAAAAAVELEIWRPARRKQEGRPARRRPPNKTKAETGEKPAETRGERHRKPKRKSDERGERPAKSTRPDSGYREPRKPRDREPDPDSPFAALAVLKERVGGN